MARRAKWRQAIRLVSPRSWLGTNHIAPIIEDELANVRSRLLAIPDHVAPKIAGMTDPAVVEAALRDEVIAALSELSCG